ncbi:MAG: spore cortex biosynthesis protein YabQ [Clostridiales bacterium]|nr:spore cortex biosynthesis protein YabQ [Clostridiales bacterium]
MQIYYFFSIFVCGVVISYVFDLLRLFRRSFKISRIMLVLQDVIFWIISAIWVIQMLTVTNNGNLRIFQPLSLILGCYIYFKYIKSISDKFTIFLLKLIFNMARFIIKFIFKPIIKILCWIFTPIIAIFKWIYNWVKRNVTKLLQLCYRNIKNLKKYTSRV